MRAATLLIITATGIAACGPISPEKAAERCEERARAAMGPTGEIGVGVSSHEGPKTRLKVEVTTDYLRGRDPFEVYDTCVRNLTGQGPVRPVDLG